MRSPSIYEIESVYIQKNDQRGEERQKTALKEKLADLICRAQYINGGNCALGKIKMK